MEPIEVGSIAALAGLVVAGAFKLAEKVIAKKNGTGCKADLLAPALQGLQVTISTLGVKVDSLGGNVGQFAEAVNDFRRETGAKLAVIEDRLSKRRAGQ